MVIRPDRFVLPTRAGLPEDVRALDKWVRDPQRFCLQDPPVPENVAAELRRQGPREETLRDAAHLAEAFQANGKSPRPFVQLVGDWQTEGLISGPPDLTQRIMTERVPVQGTAVASPEAPEFSPVAVQYIPTSAGTWMDGEKEARAYGDLCKKNPQLARQIFPAMLHQSGLARGEGVGRQMIGFLFEEAGRTPELKAVLAEHLPLLTGLIPEAESRGILGRTAVRTDDTVVSPTTGWVRLFRGLTTLMPLDEKFVSTQLRPFLTSPDSDWRMGAVCLLEQRMAEHPELADKAANMVLPHADTREDHAMLAAAAQNGWRPDAESLLQASNFRNTYRLLGEVAGALDGPSRQRVAESVLTRPDLAAELCDPDPPSAWCVHGLKAFMPELTELAARKVAELEPEELLQSANVLALTSFVGLPPEALEKLRPLLVEGRSEPKEARHAVDRVRDHLLGQGGTVRELMLLNLGRADTHVSPARERTEILIHERILELAGELPEGPAPAAPMQELSVVQLADTALNPPDPAVMGDLSSQNTRVKVASAGLQRKAYERALSVLVSEAPPQERLKAWRQALVILNQSELSLDREQLTSSWMSGFPDLSRWGEDRFQVATELAGASPDRSALNRHHKRLDRLHGPADRALEAYRQLRETCSSEEQLEGATTRMSQLQKSFPEEALSLSSFIEGQKDPQAAIGPFCHLYDQLGDLPVVQGSFRRGHSQHLEHLLSKAKDPEITLKTWKGILPRLEAGEAYADVWFAELGLALGLAKGNSSTIAMGDKTITVGGVRLPTRRRNNSPSRPECAQPSAPVALVGPSL